MATGFLRFLPSIGIGSILVGAVLGYPVTAALSLGGDHLKPSWDKQWYAVKSYLGGPQDDRIILYKCDWATTGNILTLQNQMNVSSGAESLRKGFSVAGASFNEIDQWIDRSAGSSSLSTEHGEIIFFKSGFYVYISEEEDPKAHHSEIIRLHLKNGSGVTEDVDLKVLVYETEKTGNVLADYGNFRNGPNTRVNEHEAYQTEMLNGAMLMGYVNNDMLIGSPSSDAIFAWEGGDHAIGLDGDDLIAGEQGANHLTGGPGADHFILHSDKGISTGVFDTIADFDPVEGDVISLKVPVARIWEEHEFQSQNVAGYIWTEATDAHLDVYLRAPIGDVRHHLARIVSHDGFSPTEVNFLALIQKGHVLL